MNTKYEFDRHFSFLCLLKTHESQIDWYLQICSPRLFVAKKKHRLYAIKDKECVKKTVVTNCEKITRIGDILQKFKRCKRYCRVDFLPFARKNFLNKVDWCSTLIDPSSDIFWTNPRNNTRFWITSSGISDICL